MQKKNLTKLAIIVMFIVALGISVAVWVGFLAPKPQPFTPHYLVYQGSESRIYAVSETTSYVYADQNYFSYDGSLVPKGSGLFMINTTLRNDYSSDNPPPATGTPVAPVDGTAYISLKTTLLSDDTAVPTINLSASQFYPGSIDQTGLILASGQTGNVQLVLATNQTTITGYIVTLGSVGDSIPR
jgi:hypothetical protein